VRASLDRLCDRPRHLDLAGASVPAGLDRDHPIESSL